MDDTWLVKRIKAIAFEKRRFGYRRIHMMLKREGVAVNHKKVYRLYSACGLKVRKRAGRKKSLRSERKQPKSYKGQPEVVSGLCA